MKVPDAALEQAGLMLDRARWAASGLAEARPRRHPAHRRSGGRRRPRQGASTMPNGRCGRPASASSSTSVIKNEACSKGLVELYRNEDFVSPRIDAAAKIVELPRPAGVIFALDPRHQPDRHRLFQDLAGADDAQRHHPQPASRGQGLLRRCRAHPGRGGHKRPALPTASFR